jgi:hypothetical protein
MAEVAVGGADARLKGLIRDNPINSVDNRFIYTPALRKIY